MRYSWWLGISVALFLAGLAWGLLAPEANGVGAGQLGALEELAELITSLPGWAMFLAILAKNAAALVFSFVMSPLFLVMPLLGLLLNGWVIGVVAESVVAEHSLGYLLTGLLPHGILELPAFFMGQAAALGFGAAVMRAVISAEQRSRLPVALRTNLKFLVIALILLVPAAAVETFVTPRLLN
jgi:stage II sporulation protein M